MSRLRLASNMGQSFGGDRDVYLSAGYKRELSIEDYFGKIERQDIARRLISIFPAETWRKPPRILDGLDAKEVRDDTPFVQAWNAIATPPPDFASIDETKNIWHYLERADRLARIGQYGVLFIGFSGAQPIDQPLAKGNHNFAYCRPFSERRATFTEMDLDTDASSPRFGKPERYSLQFTQGVKRVVHHSRCIHIAEELNDDELYGSPTLEAVWNRLDDLEQVMAGSKEAFWRLVSKGLILERDPDFTGPAEEVSTEDLASFVHGLTRTLELEGYNANVLGGESVDPRAIVEAIILIISAGLGIPQRILTGSERGELASTQDDDAWNDLIRARQKLHAQPNILEPFIKRLVYAGAIPEPSSGGYFIEWPNLVDTKISEDAQAFSVIASGLKDLNKSEAERFVDVPMLISEFLPSLDASAINETVKPKQSQPEPEPMPEIAANVLRSFIPPLPLEVRITEDDVEETIEAWNDADTGYDEILDADVE